MKNIQIRNVPDELHRELKARAALERTTMSALLLAELPRLAKGQSAASVLARIGEREPIGGEDPAALVRADRDTR
jgi:hypothetical protein